MKDEVKQFFEEMHEKDQADLASKMNSKYRMLDIKVLVDNSLSPDEAFLVLGDLFDPCDVCKLVSVGDDHANGRV